MKLNLKIFIFLPILLSFTIVKAYEKIDSLAQTNEAYESILYNDNDFLDILFYKHFNNVRVNNLGTYGSSHYFATTYTKDNQRDVFAPKHIKEGLLKLEGFKPFTNLTWINAGRREQILSINHIQKFGKQASLVFNYKRISSPGIYINQEANQNLFAGEFTYNTADQIYQLKIAGNVDRIENQENGGLSKIDDFESDTLDRRSLYAVNLDKSYYTSRKTRFSVDQQFNIVNKNIDSLRSQNIYLGLGNEYLTKRREYFDFDSDAPIYSETYFDSTSTSWSDSTFFKHFKNSLRLGLDNGRFNAEAFFDYYQQEYSQYLGIDTVFNSSYTGLNLGYSTQRFMVKSTVKFGLNGYNSDDVQSEVALNYSPSDNYEVIFEGSYNLIEPEVYYKDFSSNHFKWENDSLEKEQTIYFGTRVFFKKYRLSLFANVKLLDNFMYFDTLVDLQQNEFATNNISLGIEKDYSFGKFHFKTAFIYQMTSDEIVLPLPDIVARQIVYYENKLFKRALKVRIGLNASYTTDYFGREFMPGISEFYAQRTKKIGNYPYVDFFISTHLKRAQVFFKWEHINAKTSGFTYLNTPTAPAHDRSFKFGVSWNMFD